MTVDLELEDILPALSVPAEVHDPTGLSRRRFLQGTLATAGAATLSTRFAKEAFASPIANHEGVLVIVMLGGGNDGLNTLTPISGTDRSRYQTLRGSLAIPATSLLPAANGYGFHPRLPRLAARYAQGRVAVVQGVGQTTVNDLSHFSSMASFMAGTATTARSSGWLGRYLDGLTEFDSGMRGLVFSSSVPLHLLGQRAKVTAVPDQGGMWGADRTATWETKAHAAVQAYASSPNGLSQWGDRVAQNGRAAIGMAETVDALYHPEVTTTGLTHDLTLAARLVNANLGARVIGVSVSGSFDTHSNQPYDHGELMGQLDSGIEAFFATLAPGFRDQVTLATFSEFGRRPERNDSNGTDHGTSSLMLVVGENVKGGLHGATPSLTNLDSRGNFIPQVDYRQVYATLLDKWLDGDPAQLLGGTYSQLDLFTNVPGGPRVAVAAPPPPNPAKPFPDWTALVRQQLTDIPQLANPGPFLVTPFVNQLRAGTTTPVAMITHLMTMPFTATDVHPIIRAYRSCFRRTPTWAELNSKVTARRATDLTAVCTGLLTTTEFRTLNGTMTNEAYVRWVYRYTFGLTAPAQSRVNKWVGELVARRHTRGSILALFLNEPTCVTRFRNEVYVTLLYVAMLRRLPSAGRWADRLRQLSTGTPLSTLVAEFFGTGEYAARFS